MASRLFRSAITDMAMSIVEVLCLTAAAAGIAYSLFAMACLISFARLGRAAASNGAPGVTILKPLSGDEPRLFENLSSFCDQEYENVQVIFGISDPDDAAIPIAQRVRARFADRDIIVVVDPRVRSLNLKIANVLNMMEHAKHDVLFLADSDTHVDSSYVRSIVAWLASPAVGAVTCLYRGVPNGSVASALGTLFINDQFAPSVLVAIALSPMDFCLGATIATTRSALERIGGFESVSSYLADDQMVGKRMRESGLNVALSSYVVDHDVNERDLGSLWSHELRWARTMFSARPVGYAFSFVMYAVPLALLYWVVSRNLIVGASLTLAAITLRIVLHYVARYALRCRAPDSVWLLPVRGILAACLWAATFFGRGVRWRNQNLQVDVDGRIVR
jgi:ceramide glucosyltransferase